ELRSLADYSKFNLALPAGQPFTNVQIFYDYWSSTTFAFSTPEAVIVGMIDGSVSASGKINVQSVWPVRDAAITATVLLPKTGQIVSYDTNTVKADDGALQEGVAWPSPRFSVASSGTETVVTDNLTGLMWPQDASTPTFTGTSSTCTGGTLTWQGGLDYVSCLNTNSYLGHTDWRLPNVNELESLIDASTSSPALPAGHPFTKVQASYYWSSTTYAGNTSLAFSVHVGAGYVYEYNKTTTNYYVWPIRSGQ
ncbi:MAG TPA: DUF1566 domain-containing protein, partial [Nitrospirota bacterium]|nr:DUF1566 domain-containing protein [Nitrospirota bacterium]